MEEIRPVFLRDIRTDLKVFCVLKLDLSARRHGAAFRQHCALYAARLLLAFLLLRQKRAGREQKRERQDYRANRNTTG